MAVTQPVWSLVDEAQHADFIIQLSHGVYPVADMTLIDPATMQVTKSTGVYRAFYPPGSYPTPDLSDISLPPPRMSVRANAVWMQRHIWQLSHESVQTPAYYVLMVPVWWAADRLGGPFAAIYSIRVINALIVAALAPMAVMVARVLVPTRPVVATLAAILAILLPGLNLNGTRISNDTLAAALGGLLVLLAVRWAGSGWTWRRAALIGLLLGVGLMVKLTLAGLLPVLAVSALWPAADSAWRGNLARFLLSAALAVVCLAPWFLLNLHIYGGATPGPRAARLSDSVPGPLNATFVALDFVVFGLTYWTGEPWGALPFAAPFAVLGGLIALSAPVGVVKLLRARPVSGPRGPLVVAIAAAVAMTGVALLLPAGGSFEFVGPGRYTYPALPAIAALFAIGICTVFTRPVAQQLVGALYAAGAIGVLGAGAAGLPPAPEPGPGTPPRDARVVSVTASGQFQGLTIDIDKIAADQGARAMWFEVTVSNSGPREMEWTVPPIVSADGLAAHADYLRSTHLPGDLDPGQRVTGWLFVPLDPANVHAGASIDVRFVDVAVEDYSDVQDIVVVLKT